MCTYKVLIIFVRIMGLIKKYGTLSLIIETSLDLKQPFLQLFSKFWFSFLINWPINGNFNSNCDLWRFNKHVSILSVSVFSR